MKKVFSLTLLLALSACQDISWIEQHSFAITDPAQYQQAYASLLDHIHTQTPQIDPSAAVYVGPFLIKDGSNEEIAGVTVQTVQGKTSCTAYVGKSNSRPYSVDCAQAATVRSAIQLPIGTGIGLTEYGRAILTTLPPELDSTLSDGETTTASLKYFLGFSPNLKTLTAHAVYDVTAGEDSYMGGNTPFNFAISRIDQTSTADSTLFRIWLAADNSSDYQSAAFLETPVIADGRWSGKSWTNGVDPVVTISSYFIDLEVTSSSIRLTFYSLFPWTGPVLYGEDKLTQETIEFKR